MPDSCVVLISGGLDSTTTLKYVIEQGWDARPIFVDAAQRAAVPEWQACQAVCSSMGATSPAKVDAPGIRQAHRIWTAGGREGVPIPYRNLFLTSIAGVYAFDIGSPRIALGLTDSTAPFPDCTRVFVDSLAMTLNESIRPQQVELVVPFIRNMKSEVIRFGADRSVPYNLTYSCWRGRERHCGECGACQSRKEAFKIAGVVDPTTYQA